MPRKKTAAKEAALSTADTSFNPAEFDPAMKAAAIVQDVANSTRLPEGIVHGVSDGSHIPAEREAAHESGHAPHREHGQSFTEAVGRREYPKATDPFGTESLQTGENRVRLLKSTADKAWIIRFEKNPNDGVDADGKPYSKENPHPVFNYLKSEGFRWGFDSQDGKGGWGRRWDEGHYKYEEHMHAREVLGKAAEMIGASVSQGYGSPA